MGYFVQKNQKISRKDSLEKGASYIGYYLVLLIAFVMYVYVFQGIYHLPKWNAYFFGSIGFGLHLLFSGVVLPTIGL